MKILNFLKAITFDYFKFLQVYGLLLKANQLFQQRRFEEAISLAIHTCELARQSCGQNLLFYAYCLNDLAVMYQETEKYTDALTVYRKILDIWHTKWTERSHVNTWREINPRYLEVLTNIAVLYVETGKYLDALFLCLEVVEIVRKTRGEEHPDYANSLKNLGIVYTEISNRTNALPLYQQALEILGSPSEENYINYINSFNYELIVSNLNNILICSRTFTSNSYKGDAFGDLPRECRPLSEISTRGTAKELAEGTVFLPHWLAIFVGKVREFKIIKMVKNAADNSNQMLGLLFSISNERKRMEYIQLIQENLYSFLSLISQYLSNSSEARKIALDLVLQRKAIGAEALAVQRNAILGGRYPQFREKLQDLTNLRMRIAQETLAEPRSKELAAHQVLLAQLNTQKERWEEELAKQIPEIKLKQQLRTANHREVAQALPTGAVLIEFVRFEVFDFQAVRDQSESLVKQIRYMTFLHLGGKPDKVLKPAHYLAFVLLAGEQDEVKMIDLGEAEPIDRMVASFRASITGEAEMREFETLPINKLTRVSARNGIALRKAIFDRLEEVIGDRKQLFLAPDGDLTRLPFEVLPTDSGDRLIDHYYISYLSTGRDVLRFGAVSSEPTKTSLPNPSLIIGDPNFDLSNESTHAENPPLGGRQSRDLGRVRRFRPLPGTRRESEQIAQQLIAKQLDIQLWLEGNVLESQLKAYRSPRILHIATHGFFLPDQERDPNQRPQDPIERLSGQGLENPLLRSGLALAGANTWLRNGLLPPEAEDGILTAEDISGLDLLDTELVVLSACGTGLGEIRKGEGVFGLRRTFVLAGAKRLIMSLWSVPDEQTQELMTDFYDRVLKGQPCADALREAQLEMKKKYPDNPLYWGAFIFQGDPVPFHKYG